MSDDVKRDEKSQDTTAEVPVNALSPASRAPDAGGRVEALFREHSELVFKAAYRLTGNPMDAEDVLQTVFLRLTRSGEDEASGPNAKKPRDLDQNPRGYLRRAAINASIDLLRARMTKEHTRPAEEAPEPQDQARRPDQRPIDRELRDWLRRAIATLGPKRAQILTLRFLEGLSNQEIAKILGTSAGVVAVLLFRARTQLKRELDTYLAVPAPSKAR